MKTWLYSWVIYPVVYAIAFVVGFAKPKVRDTLRLRAWKDFLSLRFNAGQPIEYWVHVASQGELEYAIPILKELESRGKRVLVTYYSISAKNAVEGLPKTLKNVSLVVPLPHDGLGLMAEFVALVHKQGVRRLLLMKYELWPGLLWECNRKGIRVILVNALRPSWFHRRLLHKLDGILSGYEFETAGVRHQNVKVVGDTRVERVLARVAQSDSRLESAVPPALKAALARRPTLVCGSMWPPDSRIVFEALALEHSRGIGLNLVWVPHELDEAEAANATRAAEAAGMKVIRLGDEKALASLPDGPLCLVVMKKGILAELYKLGKAAYVGGGFGAGIHSVWEPALCNIPVACGPRTERSPEAQELARAGRLVELTNGAQVMSWLNTRVLSHDASDREGLAPLLKNHLGASKRIVDACELL